MDTSAGTWLKNLMELTIELGIYNGFYRNWNWVFDGRWDGN